VQRICELFSNSSWQAEIWIVSADAVATCKVTTMGLSSLASSDFAWYRHFLINFQASGIILNTVEKKVGDTPWQYLMLHLYSLR
jgi:hypothetical protein